MMNASVYARALRAYSLPASIVPVVLGTTLAARGYGGQHGGHFSLTSFLVVLLGAILAHCGANVLNDYFDFQRGVDTRPEHGSGVLTRRQMSPGQALGFALLLLAGGAICGALLVREHPHTVLPLSLVGLACAVCYSAFLKKHGFGDLLIMIAFGMGLTLGAYGIQARVFTGRSAGIVAIYSIPICLLVDAILNANNIRDTTDDRAAHVRTFAAMLGPRGALRWQWLLLFGPIGFVLCGILFGFVPLWSLGTLLALPLLLRAYGSGSVEGTAQTHLAFGLLYALSFLPRPLMLVNW
jgi:1,4-dihydroxy-2-naphthoate octaprenyltransferase